MAIQPQSDVSATMSPAPVEAVVARWEQQLPALLDRLGLPTDGAIQVGAHTGQEVEALTRCGFRRLVMVEPNRDHLARLDEQLQIHHAAAGLPEPADGHLPREIVTAAAGRDRGEATLYVTEYDQQSSMLPPLLPMTVARHETIPVIPLREVQGGCNVLVVDAQGAELEVLAGADLERLHLAIIEGSTWARYSGGSTLDGTADYMSSHGWRQVALWAHVRPHVYDAAWLAPSFL